MVRAYAHTHAHDKRDENTNRRDISTRGGRVRFALIAMLNIAKARTNMTIADDAVSSPGYVRETHEKRSIT